MAGALCPAGGRSAAVPGAAFPGDFHSAVMSVPGAPSLIFWETVWGHWVVFASSLGGGDFEALVQFYLSHPGPLRVFSRSAFPPVSSV